MDPSRLVLATQLLPNIDPDIPPPVPGTLETIHPNDKRYWTLGVQLDMDLMDQTLDVCYHLRTPQQIMTQGRPQFVCCYHGNWVDCGYAEFDYERHRRRAQSHPLRFPDQKILFPPGEQPRWLPPGQVIAEWGQINPQRLPRVRGQRTPQTQQTHLYQPSQPYQPTQPTQPYQPIAQYHPTAPTQPYQLTPPYLPYQPYQPYQPSQPYPFASTLPQYQALPPMLLGNVAPSISPHALQWPTLPTTQQLQLYQTQQPQQQLQLPPLQQPLTPTQIQQLQLQTQQLQIHSQPQTHSQTQPQTQLETPLRQRAQGADDDPDVNRLTPGFINELLAPNLVTPKRKTPPRQAQQIDDWLFTPTPAQGTHLGGPRPPPRTPRSRTNALGKPTPPQLPQQTRPHRVPPAQLPRVPSPTPNQPIQAQSLVPLPTSKVDDENYANEDWERREQRLLAWLADPEGSQYLPMFVREVIEDTNAVGGDLEEWLMAQLGDVGRLPVKQARMRPKFIPTKATRMDDMIHYINNPPSSYVEDYRGAHMAFLRDMLKIKALQTQHPNVDWMKMSKEVERARKRWAAGKDAYKMDSSRQDPSVVAACREEMQCSYQRRSSTAPAASGSSA